MGFEVFTGGSNPYTYDTNPLGSRNSFNNNAMRNTFRIDKKNPFYGYWNNPGYDWSKRYKYYYPDSGLPTKRSGLDRTFDALSMPLYATAGAVRGAIDKDMSVVEGVIGGIKAGNPFGKGYDEGEHTFGKVLGDLGWNPESTLGKVGKGVLGFGLDVVLDPTTYLSGGMSALIKGTGKHAVRELEETAVKELGRKYGVVANTLDEAIDHIGKMDIGVDEYIKIVDDVADVKKIVDEGKMTTQIAESILSRNPKALSGSTTNEIDNFVRQYNKLYGLNPAKTDLTIGVNNGLLPKKVKSGLTDLGLPGQKLLFTGDSIANASDKIGIAKTYHTMRSKLYGTKIANLLSTKKGIRDIAKSDPIALYEFVTSNAMMKGSKAERLEAFAKARQESDWLKEMTPAQQQEFLEAIEDKNVWDIIQGYVKISDTEIGKVLAKTLPDFYDDSVKQIKDLEKSIYNSTQRYEGASTVAQIRRKHFNPETINKYISDQYDYIKQHADTRKEIKPKLFNPKLTEEQIKAKRKAIDDLYAPISKEAEEYRALIKKHGHPDQMRFIEKDYKRFQELSKIVEPVNIQASEIYKGLYNPELSKEELKRLKTALSDSYTADKNAREYIKRYEQDIADTAKILDEPNNIRREIKKMQKQLEEKKEYHNNLIKAFKSEVLESKPLDITDSIRAEIKTHVKEANKYGGLIKRGIKDVQRYSNELKELEMLKFNTTDPREIKKIDTQIARVNRKIADKGVMMDRYVSMEKDFKSVATEMEREANIMLKEFEGEDAVQTLKLLNEVVDEDALEEALKGFLGKDGIADLQAEYRSTKLRKLYDDEVASRVEFATAQFLDMATKEIDIGKLGKGQVMKMMFSYMPHMLTKEGLDFVRKHGKKIDADGQMLTDDFGFGQKFNPFSKSRTFKIPGNDNPTIKQANEYMREKLKGANFFSESVHEIYLARMLTHTDLMYDDSVATKIMNDFGRDYKGVVESNRKLVLNYGQFKSALHEYVSKYNDDISKQVQQGLLMKQTPLLTYDDVMRNLGLPPSLLTDGRTPMLELTKEQADRVRSSQIISDTMIRQISSPIVDKTNRARLIQIAKDDNAFMKAFDKFTHLIKLNQTTVLPSFHGRNKLSNMFLNWLNNGVDALNPRLNMIAYKVVKSGGEVDFKSLEPIVTIGKNGFPDKVHTWKDLYDTAKAHGVIDEGFFANEVGSHNKTKGILNKLPSHLDPTDTGNFILYKKGSEIGSTIENSDRFLHFALCIKNGNTVEEAVEAVNHFMFDYSDITMFEAKVMKRIIPYYTFMKKNGMLQIEQLFMQPGKYRDIAKVTHAIEGSVNEEDRINKNYVNTFAQDWIQLPFSVNNPRGRQEPVLYNPALPYMDISNITDLLKPEEMLTKTNPLLKVPIELAMNRNAFFQQPIIEEGDGLVGGTGKVLDHVGNQFGLYNVAEGFATKSGVDLGLHALSSGTGIKMVSYDYDSFKSRRIKELIEEEKKSKKRNEALEKVLVDRINNLQGNKQHLINESQMNMKYGKEFNPYYHNNTVPRNKRPMDEEMSEQERIDALMNELFK